MVVDQRGVVLYANESAERLFERGELVGKDLAVPIHSGETRQDINLIRPSGIGWAELRSAPITWDKHTGFRDLFVNATSPSARRRTLDCIWPTRCLTAPAKG